MTHPTPLTLDLELGPRSYQIRIGPELLTTTGAALLPLLPPPRPVAVVTNTTVAPLYLERVSRSLTNAGYRVTPVILPDGEVYKSWESLSRIFDALIAQRWERTSPLLALGGGVVGDITGYAAASLLRGVPYVQLPTTLLSQVDSSVGGKTGINHSLGKNLIGAFYQPRLVLIDTTTLATLPRRELLAGLAEVVKYGVIRDAELFALLERRLPALLNLEPQLVGEVIRTCCAIKAQVVAADEREAGQRALLNFGHTFGHAIESLAGYGNWLHGEAVAAGMVMAGALSVASGLCKKGEVHRLQTLLERAGLPVRAPRFPVSRYLEAMSRDKKVEGGKMRFVVMEGIGRASVRGDLHPEAVANAIQECLAPA